MKLDIPFWTWVLARRLPFFALVVTLTSLVGAGLVSRHVPNFHSSSELLINPVIEQTNSVDAKTNFEFLKFRALTSNEVEAATTRLGLTDDPTQRVAINHNADTGHVIIGYYDPNPETAFAVTDAITNAFIQSAKQLHTDDVERRIEIHEGEVSVLFQNLTNSIASSQSQTDQRIKEDIYQEALSELATAYADLQATVPDILSVIQPATLAEFAAGPTKYAMYIAVLSFAIFCGAIVVLVLEWTDTIIRRPNDIETTLGFATFGVIPDLQAVPITTPPKSTRGV